LHEACNLPAVFGGKRGVVAAVMGVVLVVFAAACGDSGTEERSAAGDDPPAGAEASDTTTSVPPIAPDDVPEGAKRLHFEVGPITVEPGQNNIAYSRGKIEQPTEDGWIVGIRPDLRLEDGSIPPVDVIHLHHGVWLNMAAKDPTSPGLPERFFAAGEEKTRMVLPAGYGYRYSTNDRWLFNYMIHNLWPDPAQVWATYDVDFIPADSPAAKNIKAARPIWMDVQNGSVYPVFDVIRGSGNDGRYTYPDDATKPYADGPAKNEWTVDRDGVLLATAGHLHPGGLHTDLWLERTGAKALSDNAKHGAPDTAHLYRSKAHYFEPAGAVSWDVAMTGTPDDWRVAVRKGDVLSTTATYDSDRASWYESMGIMVLWMTDGTDGADPFKERVDTDGRLTHGHLAENDNHGGEPDTEQYVDLTKLPSQVTANGTKIMIENFVYTRGDMSIADSVPAVTPGGALTFDNSIDAPLGNGIWHTITACKAPCNGKTGVAYPLADADVQFDSGELGKAGPPTADRLTWDTPTTLDPGTYTYFCRIHPFMRGAFRVETPGG
jgi:plastocyanin